MNWTKPLRKNSVMASDLKDFIRVYDGVLDPNLCNNAIKLFDETPDAQDRWDNQHKPQFTQMNITMLSEQQRDPKWGVIHNSIIASIQTVSEYYMKDTGCSPFWPPKNSIEQIRMKKYTAETGDRFDLHIDVGDYATARRFLVMFFYLNDVEKGGETSFPAIELDIKPKQGSVLCFPPVWMYPHLGKQPISNDKYIVGTYLHYQ